MPLLGTRYIPPLGAHCIPPLGARYMPTAVTRYKNRVQPIKQHLIGVEMTCKDLYCILYVFAGKKCLSLCKNTVKQLACELSISTMCCIY
jgi:hypothetical protein